MNTTPKKVLSVFSLCMISVTSIISLRSSPMMATEGLSAVFFYLLAALTFLIPSALMCAEMASTWPQAGGVYAWVKRGFGEGTGFLAIWLEWINNIIGFPTTLSFMAATLAYLIEPALVNNKIYMLMMMWGILLGGTFFNFLGIRALSRLNIIGALFGTLIPAAAIIILAFSWYMTGKASQITWCISQLCPPLQINQLVFFTGVLGAYAGMQITGFHAPNVEHPKRDFPRAIGLATILIVLTTIGVALAIATVIPKQQISLVTGLIESFRLFFNAFHIGWATTILVFLIVVGCFSALCSWLLGPARGLHTATEQGLFPAYFKKQNSRGMPTRILLLQAGIAILFSLLFVIMPNFNTAFWLLIALNCQSTLLMNILMFASVIYLRYKEPNAPRPFAIPGGRIGVWGVAGLGMLTCLIAIIVGFFPPAQLHIDNIWHYESVLAMGTLFYLGVPWMIYRTQKTKRSS